MTMGSPLLRAVPGGDTGLSTAGACVNGTRAGPGARLRAAAERCGAGAEDGIGSTGDESVQPMPDGWVEPVGWPPQIN